MSAQTIKGLVDDLGEALREEGVTTKLLLGGRHLYDQGDPPRIVVVPLTATYGPPMQVGTNPRELATQTLRIGVHCWGKTHDEALALHDAVLRAGRRKSRASFQIADGSWVIPEKDAMNRKGEAFTVVVSFPRAILDAPPRAEAHITTVAVDESGGTVGDGVLTPGES